MRRDPHGNLLVPRMHYKHGAYYRVASNRWRPLGHDYSEALREWARLEGVVRRARTVKQAIDAFVVERFPDLAAKTRRGYESSAGWLVAVFGAMDLVDVTRPDVSEFVRARSAPVSANRDKALLSSVYSFAIEHGWCDDNPCTGVRRRTERPRRRVLSDAEVSALCAASPLLWRAIIMTARLTGMRPDEMRTLRRDQCGDEGIDLVRSKTGAASLIEWSEALRAAVEAAIYIGGESVYVFPAKRGKPYTPAAFSRQFARLAKKAGIEEAQLRDLRRTAATAAPTLQEASALLGHDSPGITRRVYRVRDRVQPVG